MKKYLSLLIVSSLLVTIMFSCSKSDSLTNANKNEFGNIHHIDSILAMSYTGIFSSSNSNDPTLPQTYYYYFKYNSDGLPISRSGGFIQLPSTSGISSPIFSSSIKDTLIYLDNHTIEINTFKSSYNKKAVCTFSNGYLTQRVDYQGTYNDTTTFTYNASHQLTSMFYFENTYLATKTDYTYNKDTTTAITYYIDRTTGEPAPKYISSSSWWSTGTNPNPYYKQEWLKMWPDLIDRTLSSYN